MCAVCTAVGVHASALLTREEALALAYPGATLLPERLFLTLDEQRRAALAAGQPVTLSLIVRYVATKNRQAMGRAYVDTHLVRTKKESLLICLDDVGAVGRVEVTAFLEPAEYRAPQPFLNQYGGKTLTDDLHLQRALRPIAGATLTANAVTDAVRRVLAIDQVLGHRDGVVK